MMQDFDRLCRLFMYSNRSTLNSYSAIGYPGILGITLCRCDMRHCAGVGGRDDGGWGTASLLCDHNHRSAANIARPMLALPKLRRGG
eukprot:COSAG02_NODE_879_length_16244_cov_15.397956_11_plen_87_part_00